MKSNRVAVEDPLLLELGLVETDTKGRVPELETSITSIRTLRTRFELSVQMWLDICYYYSVLTHLKWLFFCCWFLLITHSS